MGKNSNKYMRKMSKTDRVQSMLRDLSSMKDKERREDALRETKDEDLFMVDTGALGGSFSYGAYHVDSDDDDDDDGNEDGDVRMEEEEEDMDDGDEEAEEEAEEEESSVQRAKAALEQRRTKKREKKKKNKIQQQRAGVQLVKVMHGSGKRVSSGSGSDSGSLNALRSEEQVDNLSKEMFLGDIDALREKKKRLHRAELELELVGMGRDARSMERDAVFMRPLDSQQHQKKSKEDNRLKKRKEKQLEREAQSIIRKQQRQTDTNDKPRAKSDVFDMWGDDKIKSKSTRRAHHSQGRIKLILPHAGQSINPRLSDYKDAVKAAFSAEMEDYIQQKNLKERLQVDLDDPAVRTGGDDVVDGFQARMTGEVESNDAQLTAENREQIAKKRKEKENRKKKNRTAKAHLALHQKKIKFVSLAKKFKHDIARIPEMQKEMDKKNAARREKRHRRQLHKKEKEAAKYNPIISAGDVQLSHEMTQRLSHHSGDSFMLFRDMTRSLGNANAIHKKRKR